MRIAFGLIILAATTSLSSAATLKLNLAADLYEGGADFVVLVDGKEIGGGTANTADGKDFSFEIPDDPMSIGIRFTNDAAGPIDQDGTRAPGADRNLVIISASFADREWSGQEFVGASTSVREEKLVLVSNTTATLQIRPSVAATAVETSQVAAERVVNQSNSIANTEECNLIVEVMGFFSGQVELSASQQEDLNPVLDKIDCSVTVTGYSSTSGTSDINKQIALDRAEGVLAYLLEKGGKFSAREAVAAGETDRFGSDQADNRRVVVQLK